MIQEQPFLLRAHHHEADTPTVSKHVARVRGIKVRKKAVARTLRIESADALQAIAHRGDADRDQRLGVCRGGWLEGDGRRAQACFQPSVSPPRSGFSEASPNGTLAGSS